MDSIIRLGRQADNDIVINDASVSGHHARISLSEGQWRVEDLQSTNGTFVNGRRVLSASLQPGDRLQLGKADATVFWEQHVRQAAARHALRRAFADLESVYRQYMAAKLALQRDNKATGVLGALPYVGGAFRALLSDQDKKRERLILLDEQFKIDYVCPQCKNFLGHTPWQSLANRGTCNFCKTTWVDA